MQNSVTKINLFGTDYCKRRYKLTIGNGYAAENFAEINLIKIMYVFCGQP